MSRKIYIVDKSKQIPRMVGDILGADYEVKSNSVADLALLEIIAWRPDLLITGVEIGNITGFDLCMILKMMPKMVYLPVILLSSHKDKDTFRRLAEVGADYYIEKTGEAFGEIELKVREIFHDQGTLISLEERQARKVLLVDDSFLVRTVLANMLECAGVGEVVQAEHGEEALAYLDDHRVDLIITDYHMPVMDGPALVRKVRETPGLNELPIVVATAEQQAKHIDRILADGANGVLHKPVSGTSLSRLLASYSDGSISSLGFSLAGSDDE